MFSAHLFDTSTDRPTAEQRTVKSRKPKPKTEIPGSLFVEGSTQKKNKNHQLIVSFVVTSPLNFNAYNILSTSPVCEDNCVGTDTFLNALTMYYIYRFSKHTRKLNLFKIQVSLLVSIRRNSYECIMCQS